MPNTAESYALPAPARELPADDDFSHRLCELEGGSAGFLCGSTESALALAMLVAAGPGGRVLYHLDLAPRSLAWFQRGAAMLGIQAEPVAAHDPARVAEGLSRGARALFVQQFAHETLRELDVRALGWHCRSFAALLCVDNTHPTPPLRAPLKHGADIVLQRDVQWLAGEASAPEASLLVRDAALGTKLRAVGDALGALVHDAARERRLCEGLASLSIRADHAQRSARQLIERLQALGPGVRVGYPGLGNTLALTFGDPHAAARLFDHLPAALRDQRSAAKSQLSLCGGNLLGGKSRSVRIQVGLDAPDALWGALSSALAAVPEALVLPGAPAP